MMIKMILDTIVDTWYLFLYKSCSLLCISCLCVVVIDSMEEEHWKKGKVSFEALLNSSRIYNQGSLDVKRKGTSFVRKSQKEGCENDDDATVQFSLYNNGRKYNLTNFSFCKKLKASAAALSSCVHSRRRHHQITLRNCSCSHFTDKSTLINQKRMNMRSIVSDQVMFVYVGTKGCS